MLNNHVGQTGGRFLLGAVAFALCLFAGQNALAQRPDQRLGTQVVQAGQSDAQSQTFVGTIGKSHGQEVLKSGYATGNPKSKSTYKLDDQEKAKQYSGKNVKVTGTLDSSTNTIHVSDIQPAS
jgi:hypothetical protein